MGHLYHGYVENNQRGSKTIPTLTQLASVSTFRQVAWAKRCKTLLQWCLEFCSKGEQNHGIVEIPSCSSCSSHQFIGWLVVDLPPSINGWYGWFIVENTIKIWMMTGKYCLVVEPPSPLKNDGLRKYGKDDIPYKCSKPPTSRYNQWRLAIVWVGGLKQLPKRGSNAVSYLWLWKKCMNMSLCNGAMQLESTVRFWYVKMYVAAVAFMNCWPCWPHNPVPHTCSNPNNLNIRFLKKCW